MNDDLPNGWLQLGIAQIAEINPRHDKNLLDDLDATFVSMGALSETGWCLSKTETRKFGAIRKGYTHFSEGDVLFAKITPCMENGKAAVASGLVNGVGCGTTEVHVLRPHHGIEPKFVYHFIHQLSFRQEAARNFTGTAGQLRVPVSFIREARIPLPPSQEQKRIVAKLEKLLSKVETSQKRLKKIPQILKRFRQSVLAAACSGRLTADWPQCATEHQSAPQYADPRAIVAVEEIVETPKQWHWVPLAALCNPKSTICYGVIKLGGECANGVPCLRTSDVKSLYIVTNSVKRISPEISNEYRRTLLEGGELLVNVRGTLGGVAVVPTHLRGWNISREVARVPVQNVVSKYVAFWIASVAAQNWLNGVAKGVAYTGINIEDLRLLPIALPSLREQEEIVRRVEGLFKLADEIEARYQKAKAHVDKLTQAILAKAFRGELVPQDPNDEPASTLLQKIKKFSGTKP